ncbi:hypothetical protein M2092_002162 [Fusobacterium sp. PH5-44]
MTIVAIGEIITTICIIAKGIGEVYIVIKKLKT